MTRRRRPGRRACPAVQTLRKVLVQNCALVIHASGREVVKRRENKQPEGDGIPPGRYPIASPHDAGARGGAQRDESRPGCRLHVTEACGDAPPCGCAGPGHDRDRDAAAVPDLVTGAAATSAAVTGTEMTGAAETPSRRRAWRRDGAAQTPGACPPAVSPRRPPGTASRSSGPGRPARPPGPAPAGATPARTSPPATTRSR